MHTEELFAILFALVVLSGVAIVIMGLRQRSQQLELQHRERMAMIERGIVPSPEGPPSGGHRPVAAGVPRSMSLGIVIVAAGLGLMTLIGVAFGESEAGVGVGGAIAIIGTAFIVKSLVSQRMSGGEP
jgi:hypothetical protein